LTVTVDADVAGAHVLGDSVTDQGVYYVPPHSDTITFDVGTDNPPDASSPRVDRVALQILDDTHDGSGENLAQLVYLVGTPTAGASLDNQTGAPDLPDSACEIATVHVAANATTITDSDIRDKRPAGGARKYDVGEIIYKGSANAPFGAVAVDGSALKRNQHVELFAEIGTVHGTGDGSTTFALPDHKGRSPAAVGSGTDTNGSAGAFALGDHFGEYTHGLTSAENGPHSHPLSPTVPAFTPWTHSSHGAGAEGVVPSSGGGDFTNLAATQSSGSATKHNTVHPVIGLQAYIYSGKA
jgi:microcystin-dependent protein